MAKAILQNASTKLLGDIANVVPTDYGDAQTYYKYFKLGESGFDFFSVLLDIVATTVTLEASNDMPDVADGDAFWLDVTNTLTGSANYTVDGHMVANKKVAISRLRLKCLTTHATNSLSAYTTISGI